MSPRHRCYNSDALEVSIWNCRHLRYFVGVGEEQHFGRAAERLHVAQPALSRQIQDLEERNRVSFVRPPPSRRQIERGRNSYFWKMRGEFWRKFRRLLGAPSAWRAARPERLRVGFVESISWHGVVPESFRWFRERQPNAELTPIPMLSLAQVEAIRSGRLDAGFIVSMGTLGKELDQRLVAQHRSVLAAPKGHPLTRQTKLRLRDLNDVPFICFPRRANPAAYDRLMEAMFHEGA